VFELRSPTASGRARARQILRREAMQRVFGAMARGLRRASIACRLTRPLCPVSPAITASRVVRPLERDEALLDRERLAEEDGPHVAHAFDGAAGQELSGAYPAVLTADPAEQREIRLPHHRHGSNLDRVLVSHGAPLWSPRRAHVARGDPLPSSRCGAENGLACESRPNRAPRQPKHPNVGVSRERACVRARLTRWVRATTLRVGLVQQPPTGQRER
jgi:hypothetical protein